MTNYEKWLLRMRDVPAPKSYIDFGFYFMIGAALQRRVWTGPNHFPLFANQYVVFVGKPGVGKGLVLKPVEEFLSHAKMKDPNAPAITAPKEEAKPALPNGAPAPLVVDPLYVQALEEVNYHTATSGYVNKPLVKEAPLLFPMAANATTWEALVHAMTKSTRRINYVRWDETLKKEVKDIYTHSSMAAVLEELSSFFRKHTENVARFMLQTYDCGDYRYDNIGRGEDKIRKCCFSLLAGTQPDFMEEVFADRLLNQGFASRTWFIYETSNRWNSIFFPELDEEQKQAEKDILAHLKYLSKLYGRITYTEEAWKFLDSWWRESFEKARPNTSPLLDHYYSRKNMHTQKLALAIHFAECTEEPRADGKIQSKIGIDSCQKALQMLGGIERKMHLALAFDSRNPLSKLAKKIKGMITTNGPQTSNDLLLECFNDANTDDIKETLEYLIVTGQIKPNGGRYHLVADK